MSDAEHFEAFMRNYQDMVFSTALRLVASHAEAEDIAQEVFLKAYDHFADLRDSPTAGGWLRKVARNLSLNHLSRYRSRWSFFSELFARSDDAPEEFDFPAPDQPPAGDGERRELLEAALQKLPTAQRVPLVLYHIEGLSYEEIAARLAVSLGKVKTDIHRARQALRKRLPAELAPEHVAVQTL